jgi:nucleotide-binding universal stress UspA family protein
MLLTIDVPFDEHATAFALETAAATGAELYVCDAVPIALGSPANHVARSFGEHEARADQARVAGIARAMGVRTTQVVFHNPKPVTAALEVVVSEGVGLLVFGPDRDQLGRWTFSRAAKRVRRDAPCLVWVAD